MGVSNQWRPAEQNPHLKHLALTIGNFVHRINHALKVLDLDNALPSPSPIGENPVELLANAIWDVTTWRNNELNLLYERVSDLENTFETLTDDDSWPPQIRINDRLAQIEKRMLAFFKDWEDARYVVANDESPKGIPG